MKTETLSAPTFRSGHHHQIMDEKLHDPIHDLGNMSGPALCSNCGCVHKDGRWQWIPSPSDAHLTRCPACKRVHQKLPAGYVTISGQFAHEHRDEMLSLIHHLETREKAAHPLKRIMWIEYHEEGVTVATTDIHLAQSIGEALHRAYKGELDYQFNEGEYLLRLQYAR